METKIKYGFVEYDLVKMSQQGYWYLATPYSRYPDGHEAAFSVAVANTAELIKNGVTVFCPIAHTHPIVAHPNNDLKSCWDTWKRFDMIMIKKSVGLIVCKLKSWEDSVGVKEEIEYARSINKPIVYMDPV